MRSNIHTYRGQYVTWVSSVYSVIYDLRSDIGWKARENRRFPVADENRGDRKRLVLLSAGVPEQSGGRRDG